MSAEDRPVRDHRLAVPIPANARRVLSIWLGITLIIVAVLAAQSTSAATISVTIQGFEYHPDPVTINVGDSITWTNLDTAPHTATDLADPRTFDTGVLNKDESATLTFNTPGTFDYFCIIHPSMTARLIVQGETPTQTPTESPTTSPTTTSTATPIEDPLPTPIQQGDVTVKLESTLSGIAAPLWAINAPGDAQRLFVVDQNGPLWAVDMRTGNKTKFADVSSLLVPLGAFGPESYDERGFLGVAFHPNYAVNGLLYTYTSEPRDNNSADFSTIPQGAVADHRNVVREWHVPSPMSPDSVVDPNSSRVLFRNDHPQFNHNGGALNFGPDGLLYIAVGDGGNADDQGMGHSAQGNAQDLSNGNILGKILRIDPMGRDSANGQYSIPTDNPFTGQFGPSEVYAYGFRNPYRFSFDSATGKMMVADVGQNDIEEVDVVEKGRNYGWRIKEGTFRFEPDGDQPGFVYANTPGDPANINDPIAQYDHDEGIAVVGGFVYHGAAIPQLRGRYVFGDYARGFGGNNGRLFYLTEQNEIRELRLNTGGGTNLSLLGMGQDSHGELYVLGNTTSTPFGNTGVVLKIGCVPNEYTDCGEALTATLTGEAEVDQAGNPNKGDLDGIGSATIILDADKGEICYNLSVSGITLPARAAHIHIGAPGTAGDVVVPLTAPDGSGSASGCTMQGVTADVIRLIRDNPGAYYVNVHNADFPAGALRGQLMSKTTRVATLTGSNGGDSNGMGAAFITLHPDNGQVCYAIGVWNIALPALAAHIHVGAAGQTGDVVVPLAAPGANGSAIGCQPNVDHDLIMAILNNPANYYVNVHNADYTGGAVRGQLMQPHDNPYAGTLQYRIYFTSIRPQ